MTEQRLRNLTTGKLHTSMPDIYEDIEYLTGEKGIMTHQIPNALRALRPFLNTHVKEARFWDRAFDITHDGEYVIEPMTEQEQRDFWKRYSELPNPLGLIDKDKIIAVKV